MQICGDWQGTYYLSPSQTQRQNPGGGVWVLLPSKADVMMLESWLWQAPFSHRRGP